MSLTSQIMTDRFITVEVHDPDGQGSVLLEGLRASTYLTEVKNRACVELGLPHDVEWNTRENRTGRLLHDEQQLSQLVDESQTHIDLTMQPDASLG